MLNELFHMAVEIAYHRALKLRMLIEVHDVKTPVRAIVIRCGRAHVAITPFEVHRNREAIQQLLVDKFEDLEYKIGMQAR